MADFLQDDARDWNVVMKDYNLPVAGSIRTQINANPNRWGFFVAVGAGGGYNVYPVLPGTSSFGVPVTNQAPFTVFKYDDWGGAVFFPWYVGGPPGGLFTVYEIIYLPFDG